MLRPIDFSAKLRPIHFNAKNAPLTAVQNCILLTSMQNHVPLTLMQKYPLLLQCKIYLFWGGGLVFGQVHPEFLVSIQNFYFGAPLHKTAMNKVWIKGWFTQHHMAMFSSWRMCAAMWREHALTCIGNILLHWFYELQHIATLHSNYYYFFFALSLHCTAKPGVIRW